MAVRVRVRIEAGGRAIETSGFVNSGFEVDIPLIVLPLKAGEKLGFELTGLREESWRGPGGVSVMVFPLKEKVKISVVTEDRVEGPVETHAAISVGETEVTLNDFVSSELKIALEDMREGIWRFRDEQKTRRSVAKEEW